jgi:hypothetical protein
MVSPSILIAVFIFFACHIPELVRCPQYLYLPNFLTILQGIASLFLPVEESKVAPSNVKVILELQAVAPTEGRSWFLDNEVVSGECMAKAYAKFLETRY